MSMTLRARFDSRQITAIVGLASLWPCLQSSGFYPLTLVPSIGATAAGVVARYHLLYSLELLVAFAGIIALRGRMEPLLRSNRALPLVAGLCGLVGQSVLAFGISDIIDFAPTPLLMAALLLIAVFIAVFVTLWGCRMSGGGPSHGALDIALSYLLSQVLITLYSLTGLPMGPLLCCCSVTTAVSSLITAPVAASESAQEGGSLRQLPWRIVGITVFLIWFCIVYVRLLIPSYEGDSSATSKLFAAVLGMCTYAVVVVYLIRKPGASDRFIAIFILLIGAYMLGLLVIAVLSDLNGVLSRRVLIASEHCLEAFLWMILCDTALRRRISPALVFGLYGIAVVDLPWVFSFDLRYLAPIPEDILANDLLIPLAAVTLFVTALFTVIFLFQHMRVTMQELAQQADSSRQQVVASSLDGLGLTEREMEVATLVYRGYSAKRIAQTLYVSEPSVKNCTSRVYRKLGIHSKQELISYIDERGGIS